MEDFADEDFDGMTQDMDFDEDNFLEDAQDEEDPFDFEDDTEDEFDMEADPQMDFLADGEEDDMEMDPEAYFGSWFRRARRRVSSWARRKAARLRAAARRAAAHARRVAKALARNRMLAHLKRIYNCKRKATGCASGFSSGINIFLIHRNCGPMCRHCGPYIHKVKRMLPTWARRGINKAMQVCYIFRRFSSITPHHLGRLLR